jgi:hypothetical protein
MARAWMVARGEWQLDAEAGEYGGLSSTFAQACRLADADYLLRLGDPERLRAWLGQHSAAERFAIRQHLSTRTKPCR